MAEPRTVVVTGGVATVAAWVALVVALGHWMWRNVALAAGFIDASHSDFAHYYQAARQIAEGASPFAIHNFDYPPLMAVVALPLAPLPYVAARWVWFAIGHLCLASAAVLLWRRLGGGHAAAVVVAIVWSACGTVAENLVLGQVNPILLLLVVVAMTTPGRAAPSAVAVATALKLWPGVLLAGATLSRKWRHLALGLVLTAALVLGPLVAFRLLLPAPHLPRSAGYWRGTPAVLNLSLPATVLRLADLPRATGDLPDSWRSGNDPRALHLTRARAALSVGSAVIAMLGGLTWVGWRSRDGAVDQGPLLAALVTVALVAAPISWYHYRLLHLPGIAWLALGWWRARRLAGMAALTVLALAVTWAHTLDTMMACPPWVVLVRGGTVVVLEVVLLGLYLRERPPGARGLGGRGLPGTRFRADGVCVNGWRPRARDDVPGTSRLTGGAPGRRRARWRGQDRRTASVAASGSMGLLSRTEQGLPEWPACSSP